MSAKKITVALAGNPNSGKTSIFNALTGAQQKTGNYAGVTVEKKEGTKKYKDYEINFIDLPGTYSLTAYSMDEIVARDFLINEQPDIIVDVIDSTNLERNLFLCLQFRELGIPIIGALNMSDQAAANGITVKEKVLSEILKIPFVKTVASTGKGRDELLDEIIKKAENKEEQVKAPVSYGAEIEKEVNKLLPIIRKDSSLITSYPEHWLAVKLLEKDVELEKNIQGSSVYKELKQTAEASIKWIEEHFGMDSEIAVSEQRYGYIHGAVSEAVDKELLSKKNITEAVDKVLINRFFGPIFFLVIVWGIFQLTFTLGEHPMAWFESFFGFLSTTASGAITNEFARSLVVDGIIGGVGGVFSFVPLIVLLFLFISFLEDTGYMARAAFVMDKFLHIFGLHGQSFMPMMLGFGCSVPAIMAARTLKNPRDRIVTILVTPFMSCGAKLPVYILLAGAFFSRSAGNVVLTIYVIGAALALISAAVLRRTVLKGDPSPFVMELPPYRLPTFQGVLWHVRNKTWSYIKKAGTVILAASIIIWVITSFPEKDVNEQAVERFKQKFSIEKVDRDSLKEDFTALKEGEIDLSELDETQAFAMEELQGRLQSGKLTIAEAVEEAASEEAEVYVETMLANEALEYSIAGRIGKVIEPLVKPLGFDWRIGISAITGFAAKEVVVSTLGVLYSVGTEEGEDSEALRERLVKDKSFNRLTALSLMIFTLIFIPCIATLGVIRSELGWKWLAFAIVFTSATAWLMSFLVYQIGSIAGLGV